MKSLVNELKEHLNRKIEIRKLTEMSAVYNEVVSIFDELKREMVDYSIGENLLVDYIKDDYRKSTTLKVDTSLLGSHLVRRLKVEPDPHKTETFLVECTFPDLKIVPPPRKIAIVKVRGEESIIEILDAGLNMGIGQMGKVIFTRSEFEDLIKKILLYKA